MWGGVLRTHTADPPPGQPFSCWGHRNEGWMPAGRARPPPPAPFLAGDSSGVLVSPYPQASPCPLLGR